MTRVYISNHKNTNCLSSVNQKFLVHAFYRDVTDFLRNQSKTGKKGGKHPTLLEKISFSATLNQFQRVKFFRKSSKSEDFL